MFIFLSWSETLGHIQHTIIQADCVCVCVLLTFLEWPITADRLLKCLRDQSQISPHVVHQSIGATSPTPARAGWVRWGRRRTGSQHCCLRWVSHRSAGWWRTRKPPPSRYSSQSLKTDRRRGDWSHVQFVSVQTAHKQVRWLSQSALIGQFCLRRLAVLRCSHTAPKRMWWSERENCGCN